MKTNLKNFCLKQVCFQSKNKQTQNHVLFPILFDLLLLIIFDFFFKKILVWNLNITAPTPEPVTELDSTIAKEFFTILNIAQAYTEDQSFNILTFSILYSWLSSIYYNTSSKSKTIKGGKEEVEKVDK